jgi:hypothetical protein
MLLNVCSGGNITTDHHPDIIIDTFRTLHHAIDPMLCDTVCQLAQKEHFWLHLHPGHIQRMLEIIGPINELYIDIDGLKDICLLIAKIVDTYSSFHRQPQYYGRRNILPAGNLYASAGRGV